MAIFQPKAMFLKYRASRQQPYVGPACRWACANARSSIFVAIGQVIRIRKPRFSGDLPASKTCFTLYRPLLLLAYDTGYQERPTGL